MRRKNTSKSQTNFYSDKKLLLLSAMLFSILAGGCTGSNFSSKNVWEKTKSTVRSAYFKTQKSVTNTLISIGKYQRDHAYGRKDSRETKPTNEKSNRIPAAPSAETPRMHDRFPSRTPAEVEENLRSGHARQTSKTITRDETSKEIPLAPRTTMTLEELRQRIQDIEQERIRSRNPAERRRLAAELRELERMLLTYQKEENIIEEMTQLRRRLRKLQEDLSEIQPNR